MCVYCYDFLFIPLISFRVAFSYLSFISLLWFYSNFSVSLSLPFSLVINNSFFSILALSLLIYMFILSQLFASFSALPFLVLLPYIISPVLVWRISPHGPRQPRHPLVRRRAELYRGRVNYHKSLVLGWRTTTSRTLWDQTTGPQFLMFRTHSASAATKVLLSKRFRPQDLGKHWRRPRLAACLGFTITAKPQPHPPPALASLPQSCRVTSLWDPTRSCL